MVCMAVRVRPHAKQGHGSRPWQRGPAKPRVLHRRGRPGCTAADHGSRRQLGGWEKRQDSSAHRGRHWQKQSSAETAEHQLCQAADSMHHQHPTKLRLKGCWCRQVVAGLAEPSNAHQEMMITGRVVSQGRRPQSLEACCCSRNRASRVNAVVYLQGARHALKLSVAVVLHHDAAAGPVPCWLSGSCMVWPACPSSWAQALLALWKGLVQ